MTACTAFFLRFLLPPLYASLGITLFVLLFEATTLLDAASLFVMAALFGYIFAGVPALLFATAMKHIETRCDLGSCLLNATLLGGVSGAVIGALTGSMGGVAIFAGIGLVVGGLVEGTVILLKRRACRVH